MRELPRRRPLRRRVLLVMTAIAALVATACSDGHSEIRALPSAGWSSYGGNGANSNFAYPQIPEDLALSWSRNVKGTITAPVSLSGHANVGVTSTTANGCNTFIFDPNSGRRNFCKRMRDGVATNTMFVDQFDQPYLGEASTFLGFSAGGAIRWRMPVWGVALSAKSAGPGMVLVTTTQGQLLLLDTQTKNFLAPEVLLRDDVGGDTPAVELADCATGGPACAIAAPAAVHVDTERFFTTFRPADPAADTEVRAFSYKEVDGERVIRQIWSADIDGGAVGPVSLSADGRTAYVFSRAGRIVALHATTGAPKWTHDNGGFGFATMSVSPDGLIIPTPGPGAPLTLLRDNGKAAEPVWRRDDLRVASLSTLTDSGTAWSVVRDTDDSDSPLSLIEVSTSDGATLRTLPLPNSTGFATGVSISAHGQVVTAIHSGEVYFFDSAAHIDRR